MGCIVLDVMGIGLGPFNLSLAALLVQANESKKAVTSNITSLFFEKNSDFNWHEGMLLPKTTLQVPFFADLVTLVAPTSRYGFLNYLSHKKRLLKFYFLENFKIPRQEYNDYCQWAAHQLPNVAFGVMSGPNLAKEIMNNMPSATVIASQSAALRLAVQTALHSAFFRVFASDDLIGVELGGALKNIYAIAMGMAAAYDIGENTKAMILTRALAEMSRFGVQAGANPLTFLGLSGVGDLYATCSSTLSRNYQIGNMLGRGMSLDQAIKKLGQTAEGINTIQQVNEKAMKAGIYMPITHALHDIIYEDKAPLGVALNLMEAGFRSDVEFVMPHQVQPTHN